MTRAFILDTRFFLRDLPNTSTSPGTHSRAGRQTQIFHFCQRESAFLCVQKTFCKVIR